MCRGQLCHEEQPTLSNLPILSSLDISFIPASQASGVSAFCPVFYHLVQCHAQAECKTTIHSSHSPQYCKRHPDRTDLRDGTSIPFYLFSEAQLWSHRNKRICEAEQLYPASDGAVFWRSKASTACRSCVLSSMPLLIKVWSPHHQYSLAQKTSWEFKLSAWASIY